MTTESNKQHSFTTAPTTSGHSSERQRCDCGQVMAKRARNADDEQLLINEAFMLGNLRSFVGPEGLPFLPEPVLIGPDGDGMWTNQFTYLDGWYNLEEVKAKHGPLDHRDVAWMFRRLLVVLGLAMQGEIVHGAPLPPHVMIHPEKHGLVLVDWTQAMNSPAEWGDVYDETTSGYASWYPAEAHAGSDIEVDFSTDVYLAASTAVWLMGGNPAEQSFHAGVERETRAFFTALLAPDTKARQYHPHEALGYYDELLEKLYGPRKFRPFSMEDA